MIRSYLPVHFYFRLLHCAGTFATWHVSLFKGQSGFWVEYRNGIDAIWTGKSLPRYEDTFEERLGLPDGLIEEAMRLPAAWPEDTLGHHNATNADLKEIQDVLLTTSLDREDKGAEMDSGDIHEGVGLNGEVREESAEEKAEREKLEAAEEYERLLGVWEQEISKINDKECRTAQALREQAGNATMTDEQYRNCTLGIPLNETVEQYEKRMARIESWMSRYKVAKQREEARDAAVAEHKRKIADELNARKDRHIMKKKALIKIERNAQKILRRAYYAKSLRWHPDRWVGLSYYAEQVRHTFESVTDAYDGLQALITRLSEANSQAVIKEEELIEGSGLKRNEDKSKRSHADGNNEGGAGEPIVTAAPVTPETNPDLFS